MGHKVNLYAFFLDKQGLNIYIYLGRGDNMIKIKLERKSNVEINLPDKGLYILSDSTPLEENYIFSSIAGLCDLKEGQVIYNGKDLSELNEDELSNYRNNEIALITSHFFLEKNVRKTFLAYARLSNDKITDEDITKALELVGLDLNLDMEVSSLDEKQKALLVLARALIKNPKVILIQKAPVAFYDLSNLKKLSSDILIVFTAPVTDSLENSTDGLVKLEPVSIDNEVNNNSFSLKKHKVSFLTLLKYLKYGLRKTLKSGIFSILLFALGLTFIGLASTYFFYDSAYANYSILHTDEPTLRDINKYYEYKQDVYVIDDEGKKHDLTRSVFIDGEGTVKGKDYLRRSNAAITKNDLKELNKNSSTPSYFGYRLSTIGFENESEKVFYNARRNDIFIEANDDFLKKMNFQYITGKYPTSNNELLISSYVAESLLDSMGESTNDYFLLVGKEFNASFDGVNDTFVISGVFFDNVLPLIYDSLKKTADELQDEYDNYQDANQKKELLSLITKMRYDSFDNYFFVSDDFLSQYEANYYVSYENYTMKAFYVGGYERYITSFISGVSGYYNSSCFVPFEDINCEQEHYSFYDLDGNVINNPILNDNECYIPYVYIGSDTSRYFYDIFGGNDTASEYIDDLVIVGYFKNPENHKLNPIINSSTFGDTKTYKLFAKAYTSYHTEDEYIYDGALTFSKCNLFQIKDLFSKSTNGKYYVQGNMWLDYAVKFDNPTLLIWGIIIILISLISLNHFMKCNLNVNEYIFFRRSGLSESNFKKIILFNLAIVMALAYLVSLIGIYIGSAILNPIVEYNKPSATYIHFGIYGYLLNFGILIVTLALFIVLVICKEKNNIKNSIRLYFSDMSYTGDRKIEYSLEMIQAELEAHKILSRKELNSYLGHSTPYLREEIKKIDSQLSSLRHRYFVGAISEEEYTNIKDELYKKRNELSKALDEILKLKGLEN